MENMKELVNFWSYNHFKINTLIKLLIKKGVITKEEFLEELEASGLDETIKENYIKRLEKDLK